MKYLLTIIYIVATNAGMFFLKSGGDTFSLTLKNKISFSMNYLTLLGFTMYIISFLLWQKLINIFDLTYIVPITAGIIQITIMILGVVAFHEKINLMAIIGTFLVIGGIVLLTMGKINS